MHKPTRIIPQAAKMSLQIQHRKPKSGSPSCVVRLINSFCSSQPAKATLTAYGHLTISERSSNARPPDVVMEATPAPFVLVWMLSVAARKCTGRTYKAHTTSAELR